MTFRFNQNALGNFYLMWSARRIHLANADPYRRDRRKDVLLQQHGYLVLRFLAEDAVKHLDHMLDAILSALVHRGKNRKG